jgi:hypothetical protein
LTGKRNYQPTGSFWVRLKGARNTPDHVASRSRLAALEEQLDEGPLELDVLPLEFTADTIGVSALRVSSVRLLAYCAKRFPQQLETSAVSAIKYFSHSEALVVPRSRHLRIETLAQILMLRSDLYSLRRGVFVPFDADAPPPTIKLSHECSTVGLRFVLYWHCVGG